VTELPKWYRSWPSPGEFAEKKLDDVPHIVDGMPRLLMAAQDYCTVAQLNSIGTDSGWPEDRPGFCMLEYDVALDSAGQTAFAALALIEPRQVLVAPYRWNNTWIHFVGNDGSGPTTESRPVNPTDEFCDSFGLGCVYIPTDVLTEFLPTTDHFTDYTFGQWYRKRFGPARVTWAVHPQHVHHYDV
jgi:hypothetical protein